MRKWRSKQELSNTEIVALFLKGQSRWFDPEQQIEGLPRNSLCGKQEYAEAALLDFLKSGKQPQNHELAYIVSKFESEWVGENGIFEEIK